MRALTPRVSVGFKKYMFDFEATGSAGDVVEVVSSTTPLPFIFEPHKLIATDDSSDPGNGTRVECVIIGAEEHAVGKLSSEFGPVPGYNMFLPACPPGLLRIRVAFLAACRWSATLFGEAVVVEERA